MDPGEAALLPLLSGWYYAWAISVAARLGLPDAVAGGPLTAAELAERCNAHADALRRLLDALVALGVLGKTDEARYTETPVSRFLRSDVGGSRRSSALLGGDPAFQAAWAHLEEAVRSGETAFVRAHGVPFFELLDQRPVLLALFQDTMAGGREWNEALATSWDFAGRRIVDVGGGDGSQLRALLDAHPDAEGVVLERPSVLERLAERRVEHPRLKFVAGDFFERVPAGGDVYLLRFVIHDWPDDEARTILVNCRRTMASRGRVLVLEHVRDPDQPGPTALFDLSMLVLTGGRLRSVAEHTALLESAGLAVVEVSKTPILTTFIEAKARA